MQFNGIDASGAIEDAGGADARPAGSRANCVPGKLGSGQNGGLQLIDRPEFKMYRDNVDMATFDYSAGAGRC